jgi:hypothetical protein
MSSKRDYVKAAEILHRYVAEMPFTTAATMVCEFADLFEADNPRFDRERFLRAVIAGKP